VVKQACFRVLCALVVMTGGGVPCGHAYTLKVLSQESQRCAECHKKTSPSIHAQWGSSKHYGANVGCYECHRAEARDSDAFMHEGKLIATIVSPRDCARCHENEVREFIGSRHAKAGRIIGSIDNTLAEVVQGNKKFITPAFPDGIAASAVSGCWQCHGSEVKVVAEGKLDPATWPNAGIGRINPDGSEGSCRACHAGHTFSASQARHPDTCGKCHLGPDHPQLEIYNQSKHGNMFRINVDKMNLDNAKWIVGEDYSVAPTCATCHMSATPMQPVSHDVGMRISWNNRPPVSIRPEVADAEYKLKGASVPWQERRENMQDVCRSCHGQAWVTSFYLQYDALIDLYHEKFALPGFELMKIAEPLIEKPRFSSKVDFIWYELWHHEGRRARHGVSMMGPDYTHWHGTYEVAKHFYTGLLPELRKLVDKGMQSSVPAERNAAVQLQKKIDELIKTDNHTWLQDTNSSTRPKKP